jgi:hypothetical protein
MVGRCGHHICCGSTIDGHLAVCCAVLGKARPTEVETVGNSEKRGQECFPA